MFSVLNAFKCRNGIVLSFFVLQLGRKVVKKSKYRMHIIYN